MSNRIKSSWKFDQFARYEKCPHISPSQNTLPVYLYYIELVAIGDEIEIRRNVSFHNLIFKRDFSHSMNCCWCNRRGLMKKLIIFSSIMQGVKIKRVKYIRRNIFPEILKSQILAVPIQDVQLCSIFINI